LKKTLLFSFLGILLFNNTAVAGTYPHFDTEKAKPGVIYSKAYRSTDDARDGYNSGDDIPFGSDGSAYYDPNLDGTVIPLKYNVNRRGVMYARNDTGGFTPNTGPDIWVQWEQWVDQNFIDDMDVAGLNKGIPIADEANIYNTKLFRLGSAVNRCGDHPELTTFYFEVYSTGKKWYMHERPECNFSGLQMIGDSSNAGNRWMRFTWNINFSTKRVRVWLTELSPYSTTLLVDFTDSDWAAQYIDNAFPMFHSTALDNHGWGAPPPHTTYIFAWRNVIVSTKPINFTTSSSSDTTPPSAPSGLSVK